VPFKSCSVVSSLPRNLKLFPYVAISWNSRNTKHVFNFATQATVQTQITFWALSLTFLVIRMFWEDGIWLLWRF
ncbi:8755_t:CDS:2, partial [Entrophospora sp. SA101]